MNQIRFFSADRKIDLKNRNRFKINLAGLFKSEGKKLKTFSVIFCSDDFLLSINQQHLNHNYYTDIITFQLSNKDEPLDGEVYISVDRIKENAKIYLTLYQIELRRVMIHGALHLCGFNDKTRKEQEIMKMKEDYYIKKFSRET